MDGLYKLQKWVKEQKEDRKESAIKLLKEGETGRKRYVFAGELTAYEQVEDEIEKILKEPRTS